MTGSSQPSTGQRGRSGARARSRKRCNRSGSKSELGFTPGRSKRSAKTVRGVTVHIGARVAALAGPSEVLVSQTVKDLVVGSGLVFEDRGSTNSKGSPTAGACTEW